MVYDRGRSVDYVGWFLNENILHRFISSLGHFVRLIRNASFQLHIAHSVTSAQNSTMFVMNFVHLPPAALQVLAVMYLATHCCAMWLVCSRGQCKFPGSVDGIIHMSAKRLSNTRISLLFTKDKLTTSKLNLLVRSVNQITLSRT